MKVPVRRPAPTIFGAGLPSMSSPAPCRRPSSPSSPWSSAWTCRLPFILVMPAQAGIQGHGRRPETLDSRLRGNDGSTSATGDLQDPVEIEMALEMLGKTIQHRLDLGPIG